MTVMFPEDFGIHCPDDVKHMYAYDAVSPGDGEPVVTLYPQYPMSAWELWDYMKGKHPSHCKDLQKKYPTYFDAHTKSAMGGLIRGRKALKKAGNFQNCRLFTNHGYHRYLCQFYTSGVILMFEITDETRNAAIAEMRAALLSGVNGEILNTVLSGHEADFDARLGDAFDAAVVCVKRQFGM